VVLNVTPVTLAVLIQPVLAPQLLAAHEVVSTTCAPMAKPGLVAGDGDPTVSEVLPDDAAAAT
jgi:hypothetical protein